MFDESGIVAAVDFDYDAIDAACAAVAKPPQPIRRLAVISVLPQVRELVHERTSQCLGTMLDWITQKVPRNNNGIEIRAVVAAHALRPYLREYSLTQISALIGRDKQALGRWRDEFIRQFPGVINGRATRTH